MKRCEECHWQRDQQRWLGDGGKDAMMEALEQLKEEYGTYFAKVFQTIIADNGSEFGRLSELTGDSVKTCFRTPLDKLFQFSVCKTKSVYEMAKQYYPQLWDLSRIETLVDTGRLCRKKVDKIIERSNAGKSKYSSKHYSE